MEENIKKEKDKKEDKDNNEDQIKKLNQIFEEGIKTLSENKLIQFTKNSYNIRLKLYNKQIKDLEESYKEIDIDFHSFLKEGGISDAYSDVRYFLIFFNCTNIIFNWFILPSNEVCILINNIIKSFDINNFENIPGKPKKYHKELLESYEARLNDALKKYSNNKNTKSLSGISYGSNGRECWTSWSREKILHDLLKFKIDIRYIIDYQTDIKLDNKICIVKEKLEQLTKNNNLQFEERIDLIEKLDDNINTLIEFMTNLKENFMDCFYEWNGYYYKSNPLKDDDLNGLKSHIKNFMFNDKMREVISPWKILNYCNINFP